MRLCVSAFRQVGA